MHSVIDQSGEGLAVRADHLNDVAARVVERVGVVIEGDPSFRLAGRYFEARRLDPVERLVDGFGDAVADQVNIFQIR